MFVCVSVGVTSVLLIADGTACLLNVENACLLTPSSSIVTLIIGVSLLVPVIGCLYAAKTDSNDTTDKLEQSHSLQVDAWFGVKTQRLADWYQL
uniref:Uncharacterized protein n=1 Tax=Peronospora matthiolae TaxID=2874970 RepID=A0AAV1TDT8_9STRA